MKKLFLSAVITVWVLNALLAQTPTNDECATAIDLGIAPACDTSIIYSNDNATQSNIGIDNNPSCFNGGIPNRDVWFSFVCPDTLFDFRLSILGTGGANGIQNPQVAVYRGECTPNDLFELACAIANLGEDEVFLDLTGLTPGAVYYIRVSDYSATAAPNSGNFTLCVGELPDIITIDQGSSNQCSGILSDSGGPDEDYGPNEDYTFTICPPQPVACITFTLEYYNIEDGFVDALTFYNGPDINSPVLANIGGFANTPTVTGGGGVAFQVQGDQPCMTVAFISDGFSELEGFLGHWECSAQPCPPQDPLTINSPISNQVIVDAVTTPATQVTITNVECEQVAYGSFSYPTINNDLQMEKGLLLTSGFASVVNQPAFNFEGNMLGAPGDADLDYLSDLQGGAESYDACVVEMDVFVATDQLSFEYVFGSEEYPNFVNSSFNDIFAFLVSGPGIVGDPGLGGQKNIAILPDGVTPVEINSVNYLENWQYYRNNEIGNNIVYGGLTSDYLGIKKSLTAKTSVIPCNTYHLKLAIADRGDDTYDSGVFVSEIKGGTPNLTIEYASGVNYFAEECTGIDDNLIISIPEPLTQPTTFITGISGTATLGVDYILDLPATITFPPGTTQLVFPIFPLTDQLAEGTETIVITLSSNFGCGSILQSTLVANLEDQLTVSINAGVDTVFVCSGVTYQLQAEGATDYFWSPVSAVSNPIIANPTITTTQNVQLIVTGSLGSCVAKDTVNVHVLNPQIDVVALGTPKICVGQGVALQANNNVNGQNLTWTPSGSVSNPNTVQTIASPTVTTTYTATIALGSCIVTDLITVEVDTLFKPDLAADTTVCQNYPVLIGSTVTGTTTDYQWTPAAGLSDAAAPNPIALPDQTTTYTLVSTSANGFCSSTESVTVTVVASDVDIQGPESYQICLGTPVPLQANAVPSGGIPVVWSPSFFVTNQIGPATTVNADETVTIFATYNVNGCLVRDSVLITVDSLPDLSLSLRPAKEIYCPGDTVTLLSPTYEPANFPNIQNTWLPDGLGQITPDSLWNLVIRAQVTDTFTRITVNRGCKDTMSIVVPVDSLPIVMATVSKDKVCLGETVQLNVTVTPDQKVMWAPPAGLSCTDCKNPTALMTANTTFTVSTPEANCPAGASVTVEVVLPPTLGVPDSLALCIGETVLLNNVPAEPNTNYEWTSTPAGFSSNEAQPQVTPSVATTYTVVADNGCPVTETVMVFPAVATVNAGADLNLCEGQAAALNALVTGVQNGSFEWISDIGEVVGSTAATSVIPSNPTTYTVRYAYGVGEKCIATDEVSVNVNPIPAILSVVPTPATVCDGVPIGIKATVFGGTPQYNYAWSLDGVGTQPGAQDTFSISLNGPPQGDDPQIIYVLGLTVTDAAGCSAQLNTNLVVIRCFDIPNAFTPGNDDVNNVFYPVFPEDAQVDISTFVIYNRWGQKVFTASPQTPKWDGNVDGKPAPMDVYVYQIKVRRKDGTFEDYSGEVSLIR